MAGDTSRLNAKLPGCFPIDLSKQQFRIKHRYVLKYALMFYPQVESKEIRTKSTMTKSSCGPDPSES